MFIETLGDLYRLLSTFYYVGNGYLDFINNINIYIFILFILSILLKTKIYTNIIRFIYKLINIHSFVFFLFLLVMLLYKKENYCTIIEQILYFFCINNFINYKDHIMLIEFFILIYFLIFTITKKMLKNIIKDYIKHCIYIVFLYIGFILLIIIYGLIIVDGFGSSYEIDVLGDTAIFFYLFFINYFYQISFIFLFRKLSKDLILKLKNFRLN